MIPTKPNIEGTTADVHADGDTVRRSVTIRAPMIEVKDAWQAAGIVGEAEFARTSTSFRTKVVLKR